MIKERNKDPKKEKTLVEKVDYFLEKKKKTPKEIERKLRQDYKYLTVITHSAKFSHPKANVTPIVMSIGNKGEENDKDGYIRNGNVNVSPYLKDINRSNSYALSSGFLLLFDDFTQITVLEAFLSEDKSVQEREGRILREWCEKNEVSFINLKDCVSKMIKEEKTKTDWQVKQVYFPVSSHRDPAQYHLLSILTTSGLTFNLRERIEYINKNKVTEENKGESYKEKLLNITHIKYSTEPRNVSELNNIKTGVAYLLFSSPPEWRERAIRLPHNNFFTRCLSDKEVYNSFEQLHKFITKGNNSSYFYQQRLEILNSIIDYVLLKVVQIRSYKYQEWEKKYYDSLDKDLRILLDSRIDSETRDKKWLDAISAKIARAIIKTYEKNKEAKKLDDDDLSFIKDEVKLSISKVRDIL